MAQDWKPDPRWAAGENIEEAAVLLGRAIDRHPLLVLQALRRMMYQGCVGVSSVRAPRYARLLAHVGQAARGIEPDAYMSIHDTLTRIAAVLRQGPPFQGDAK